MAKDTVIEQDEQQSDSELIEGLNETVDKLGLVLAESRSEAIAGRQDSGIEEEWQEDEEYYEGVDDANRSELKAWRGKPLGQASPSDENKDERGSTIFLNITRPYCDAISARLGDQLNPTDDRPFAIKPTPKPEFIDIAKGKLTREIRMAIKAENENDPDNQWEEMKRVAAELEDQLAAANESARLVEQQIWDWFVECNFQAHDRRVIDDGCKVGTGVIKGPVPKEKSKKVYKDGQLKTVSVVNPESHRIYYRNCYPDPACGESIHDGNYFWERDDITMRGVQRLVKNPDYLADQVRQVISEGPMEATKEFKPENTNPGLKAATDARRNMYEIWYFHGSVRKEELLAIDLLSGEGLKEGYIPPKDEYVYISATLINDRVVKAQISHLDTGTFPYDFFTLQRRVGTPWGIGVARQIRPAQRIVVGAIRHMMDNAGVAGGPMLFMNDFVIQPAEGVAEVRPWKVYIAGPDYEPGMDIREAIQYLEAPMMQAELEAIVNLGMKFAEDITGMPLIMQGQTNPRTPHTLGGMQLQNNNASTVLRRYARNHDDDILTPHVGRYHDHILEYSEDDKMKNELVVQALGSSSLLERDLRNDALTALGQYVTNPMFGLDPKKWAAELLKANKLDAKRFEYDDEEWQKIVENMSQPKPDPRLEVAQLKITSDEKIAQFKADVQKESEDKTNALKMGLAEMEREFDIYLQEMGDDTQLSQTAIQAKESMAETMVKLRTQLYMQGQDGLGGQLTEPAVEPTGKARPGRAYAD